MQQHTQFVEARLESKAFEADDLKISRVHGREQISQLFQFDIDVVVPEGNEANTADFLGADATLILERSGVELRRVYGMVSAVQERFDFAQQLSSFRLRLVPRAHRLTFIRTQEIYFDLNIVDIVREKLEAVEFGTTDMAFHRLLGTYGAREFVVQFGESDLAFINRWTEHLGISYYFDHTEDCDRIVFADTSEGFATLEQVDTLHLTARADEPGCVYELRSDTELIPGQYWQMDYDYRQPDLELTSSAESEQGYAGGVFEYGGHFKSLAAGESLARVRAEQAECQHLVFTGQSNVAELTAGHTFGLDGHDKLDGRGLLIVSVEHRLSQQVTIHSGDSEKPDYTNSFTAVPANRTYRPPRVTPKPKIHGLLTGVIEPKEHGDVGDYAEIDPHGRYKVKFLFDTAPLGEQKASKPVRMAQPTVGPRYGMHFPLRPGVEVVLAFVNGDPDRPIIVGAVHNHKVAPHVVTENAQMNLVQTASGIKMRFRDS